VALLCCGGVVCRHQSPAVLVPALRTVGNIVTGNDMQTQVGVVLVVMSRVLLYWAWAWLAEGLRGSP
jgi:hypothetical protein